MFEPIEFRYKDTVEYLKKKIGITPSSNYSYYDLMDAIMEKDPQGGVGHALRLNRYASPRLKDYSEVIINNPELSSRYDIGVIADGKSPKAFFLEKISDVMNEFPCFNRATNVPIDIARIVSLDLEVVCGESDYKKAVFSSLGYITYLKKKSNVHGVPDMLECRKPCYLNYLKNLDVINRVIPSVLSIEEAHVFLGVFDSLLKKTLRTNRKANWGLRELTQNIVDPSDEIFELCSTTIIASEQATDESIKKLNIINATEREKRIVSSDLSQRNIFLYIRTRESSELKIKRIATKVKALISPSLLWIINSEQIDIDFADEIFKSIGVEKGIQRLASLFPNGSVKGLLDGNARAYDLAKEEGFDSVYAMLKAWVLNDDVTKEKIDKVL
jgi:hypothetical protein